MYSFVLGSLYCLSKYGAINGTNFIEPLETPKIIYRLRDFISVNEFFYKDEGIYMNSVRVFDSKGKYRWEVLSEKEVLYTSMNGDLIHEKCNVSTVVARNVSIFTVDHIYRELYVVGIDFRTITVKSIDYAYTWKKFAPVYVRDIESSAGTLLIYGDDYGIWHGDEKIAETNGLSVIPFLAYERGGAKLVPCVFLMMAFTSFAFFTCICYHNRFKIVIQWFELALFEQRNPCS